MIPKDGLGAAAAPSLQPPFELNFLVKQWINEKVNKGFDCTAFPADV